MQPVESFLEFVHSFLRYSDIGAVLITAFATLISAGISGIIGNSAYSLFSKRKPLDSDVSKIAQAVQASAVEARAHALKALVEKVPPGTSREEFEIILHNEARDGANLGVTSELAGKRQLVEDLVTTYHQQALSQARVQFWFSIMAATIGFIYILYGASVADTTTLVGVTKTFPGIVIDAIAVLFFRQAEQTRQRATELYDRLRKDRQMTRAEAVVSSIEDHSIRSAVKAQIALHMVGLSPKEIDLQTFISKIESK